VQAIDTKAPVFQGTASSRFAENGTSAAYVANASDASGPVRYTLTGGADQDLFDIDEATGAVRFKSAPNFEARLDAGADNIYDLKVTAADALIALKYASNTLPPDYVTWKFYDSSTSNLGVENATPNASLKPDMTVAGGGNVDINASNTQKDYFVQAVLVGNVTNPALEV